MTRPRRRQATSPSSKASPRRGAGLPLLLASLGLLGCPASRAPITALPPVRNVVLTARAPVPLYEVLRPVPLEGLEGRVFALVVAIASRLDRKVPSTDEAACRAARQIARGLLPEGPPPSPLVEFALRSEGIVDPPPHLLVVSAPEGGEGELQAQLEGRLEQLLRQGNYLRVGIGMQVPLQMPGERRLIVALFDARVRFRPLPRELRLGQRAALDFKVVSAHRPVHLVIAEPGGRIASEEPRSTGGSYSAALVCKRRGVYQVEVTGEGSFGTEVLANFPVYCDEPAPSQVHYGSAAPRPGAEDEVEREIFERTNQLRLKEKLPLFRRNARVAQVARQHSEDMRDQAFVGHVSPRTGNPADRLRRAGVVHLVARENVARAYSAAEAISELTKSPAHRANLLATDVDELGVGVAVERGGAAPVLLVTQNFIRGGTSLDPAAGPAPVYRIIDDRRRGARLRPLRRDGDLERLASAYLQGFVADGQQAADARLSRALQKIGVRFRQVEGVLVKISVLEGLSQANDLVKPDPTHVGVGLTVQGGQVLVFMLLATAR